MSILLGGEIQGLRCGLYGLAKTADLGVSCGQCVE
jgi:hypothetical protein